MYQILCTLIYLRRSLYSLLLSFMTECHTMGIDTGHCQARWTSHFHPNDARPRSAGKLTTVARGPIPFYRPHHDVIKWKHFLRYWPLVRGIHRSRMNSLHKGQWRGALMFSLICAWINGWLNNHQAGDLRRHCGHYDVNVMWFPCTDRAANHVMI